MRSRPAGDQGDPPRRRGGIQQFPWSRRLNRRTGCDRFDGQAGTFAFNSLRANQIKTRSQDRYRACLACLNNLLKLFGVA